MGSDCDSTRTLLSLHGGYSGEMCFEYEDGEGRTVTRDARSYGLANRQSGLLYFFDRDNAEVLVKVLDGCAVNGYRWVYVAPVTDLAFKLVVRAGRGNKAWTYENAKGSLAQVRSDLLLPRVRLPSALYVEWRPRGIVVGSSLIWTTILPVLAPRKRPMNASGAFSRPEAIVSR